MALVSSFKHFRLFCDNSAYRHQHSLNFYDLRFIHETFISFSFSQKKNYLTLTTYVLLQWFISCNHKCIYKNIIRHDAKIMYPIFQKLPGGIMDSDIHHAIWSNAITWKKIYKKKENKSYTFLFEIWKDSCQTFLR